MGRGTAPATHLGTDATTHIDAATTGARLPRLTITKVKFTSQSSDLAGHVYGLSNPTASATSYYNTAIEIAKYVGRMYASGNYTKREIETLQPQQVSRPTQVRTTAQDGTFTPPTDPVDQEIFKQEVSAYVKSKNKL